MDLACAMAPMLVGLTVAWKLPCVDLLYGADIAPGNGDALARR